MTVCPYCGFEFIPSKIAWEQKNLRGCVSCLNPFIECSDGTLIISERLPRMHDIRSVCPPGSVIANILDHLGKAMEALPVLAEIPQKIMTLVHDPLTSMSELAQVIEKDAVISVKILRLANSAYSAAIQEIKELDAACARLGLKVIANAVSAIANGNLYVTKSPTFRKMMHDQWIHSLAVAHCSDEIGVRVFGNNDPTPFKAGLVHDIGMTILLDLITTKYSGNVGRLREAPDLMVKVLDKYHTIIGLHVVQHWKLEPEILFSTLYHHNPELTFADDRKPLADVVCLANDLAHDIGYGFGPDSNVDFTEHPSAQRLGISADELESLKSGMDRKIESLLEILSVM